MPVETRLRAATKHQEEKATKNLHVGTTQDTRASQQNSREVSRKQHLQTKKQPALNKANILRNRPTHVNAHKQVRVMNDKKTVDDESTKRQKQQVTRLVHQRTIRPTNRPKAVVKPNKPSATIKRATTAIVPDLIADVPSTETPCIRSDRSHQRKKVDLYIAKVSTDDDKLPTTPMKPSIFTIVDPEQANEDDPQLCTEYVKEIYDYLLVTERKEIYQLGQDFMSEQLSVNQHHRAILIDWLMQVKARFQLLDETMYMCVEILDRTIQV